MKLALSTLLATIALLSPQALAMGGGSSIDLQYAVRDGEALYSVATANGDLRFVNQGPSAAKLRWFDPLRGEEEVRVLHPGQALLSQGHFGVPISEGTVILVEMVGQGPISTGLASIPSSASMHDSVHCLHNNGAFLPWHRGYFASVETLVGGTMCSIESYRGVLGALSSWSSGHSGGVNFIAGDGSNEAGGIVFLVGDEPRDLTPQELQQFGGQEGEALHDSIHCFSSGTDGDDIFMPNAQFDIEISSAIWTQTLNLEHGPGLHDSIHCIVGGTMCSMRSSNDPDSFTHHANIDKLLMIQTLELESGHPLPFAISLESFTQPVDGDDIFMPNAGSFIAGVPSCPELEHGPGMNESMYIDDAMSNLGGQEGEPFSESNGHILWNIGGPTVGLDGYWDWTMEPTPLSIWTSGTASIWSDGTFSSIGLIASGQIDL